MSTCVTSLGMDFKKISEGLTRERSRNPSPWSLFFKLPSGAFSKLLQALFILLEAKSMTSSRLALEESWVDLEIFFQRSLNVEGVFEDWASDCDDSIARLKHQFLPLIGNTTNLAFMIDSMHDYQQNEEWRLFNWLYCKHKRKTNGIREWRNKLILRNSADWFQENKAQRRAEKSGKV